MHGNLLENHVQFLVNVVSSTTDALQKNDEVVLMLKQCLVLKCRVGVSHKVKVPPMKKSKRKNVQLKLTSLFASGHL